MLKNFLKNKKILYINDRHEEKGNESEDRRKLYDKRILSLIGKNDFAVFGDKIDKDLWSYYRKLGLANVDRKNIFYVDNYLRFKSLTEAINNNQKIIAQLKREKFDYICPYIESEESEKLSRKLKTKLLRSSMVVEKVNNKIFYKKLLEKNNIKIIPGATIKNFSEAKFEFKKLRNKGFKKVVLKKTRSVAGFGVFVIDDEKNLKKIIEKEFVKETEYIIEGFIENIECSSNVQYWIGDNDVRFIAMSDQVFSGDKVSHKGNQYPSVIEKKDLLKKRVMQYCLKICIAIKENSCYGIVGIDILITRAGEIYSPEVNARWNASTFPALLAKIIAQNDSAFWQCLTLKTNCFQFKDFFEKNKTLFIQPEKKYGIFPVAVDIISSFNEIQLLFLGRSQKELNYLLDSIR